MFKQRPASLLGNFSEFPSTHLLLGSMLTGCASSQRNTYLTGFTLFLSLVLTRVFYIILDLIHTQEEYAKLKKNVRSHSIQL
jgi:hypothetical protein